MLVAGAWTVGAWTTLPLAFNPISACAANFPVMLPGLAALASFAGAKKASRRRRSLA